MIRPHPPDEAEDVAPAARPPRWHSSCMIPCIPNAHRIMKRKHAIPRAATLLALALTLHCAPNAAAEKLSVEKDTLKLGFIKLTDCAPLVIAKEKGFFEDEGLQVEVIAQSNWKRR